MNRALPKTAAVLAFVIGLMAVVAGGQVLLGKAPDYYVIDWLPIYNFVAGLLTVFVTAVLIWRESPYALPAAFATFGAHAVVMLVLLTAYRDVVAADSIRAMTIRLLVWLVILALMFVHARKHKPVPA